MTKTFIYITTDYVELNEILGFDEKNGYQERTGFSTGDGDIYSVIVSRNGKDILEIIEYSMKRGREIQVRDNLCFNPMCAVSGDFNYGYKQGLIRKLLRKGLFVAEDSENGIKQHFPNTPAIMGYPMTVDYRNAQYLERIL